MNFKDIKQMIYTDLFKNYIEVGSFLIYPKKIINPYLNYGIVCGITLKSIALLTLKIKSLDVDSGKKRLYDHIPCVDQLNFDEAKNKLIFKKVFLKNANCTLIIPDSVVPEVERLTLKNEFERIRNK